MKMVKSLLLGSAAGFVAIAGAQAADFPVKAKPVEYVKVCTLYGAGFYYVPGSDTCLKIGFYLRWQMEWDAAGGRQYITGANARFDRAETPDLEHRIRAEVSFDTRTQTEYGSLRMFWRGGFQQQYPAAFDETVQWDRGFIQFAGFTVGRAQSFFDFISLAPYSYANSQISTDMGATGQATFAYTQQFGNGWSASLAMEDGGASAAGPTAQNRARGKQTVDLGFGATSSGAAAVGALTVDNGAYTVPDIVANIRVDQAWGSAQLSGAIHQNKGGYYNGNAAGGPTVCGTSTPIAPAPGVANSNNTFCTHPDDEWGWAIAFGASLNLPTGNGGQDIMGAMVTFGEGAEGYVTRSSNSYGIWGHGGNGLAGVASLGVGWNAESVFASPGTYAGAGYDGSLQLTSQWAIQGFAQHYWSKEWRTSVWGGYSAVEYNDTAKTLICSTVTAAGTAPLGNAGLTLGLTGAQATSVGLGAAAIGPNCDPDFSWFNVGTRTMWSPHPYLNIGLDVAWTHLNTAHKGVGFAAATGNRAASVVAIEDQDVVTVMGRWEYTLNF